MKKESQVIFDRNVVEFVTVAAEFCKFLEQTETMKRSVFVDTSLKILPLLYLKASMLPKCETIGDEALETFVTEETYEILRMNLAGILAEKDDYLDVFVSDMKYSDQPITKNISEDLADIYQDIRDFIFVFQLGLNETMNDSLAACQEHFALYWGQKLVNTLRALEEGLEEFAGCAVVISHDRWFLDRICTHILAFEGDSKVFYFEGSYSEYEENKMKRLGKEEPKRIRYRKLMED